MAFKRLLNIARRRPGGDPSPADGPADDPAAVALDVAPLGPLPVLRPAAIFRQLLFDPAESAPVWARPRSVSAPGAASSPGLMVSPSAAGSSAAIDEGAAADAASTPESKSTKRPRRPKASGMPAAGGSPAMSRPPTATRTRSKRVAKPAADATDG